MPKYTTYLDSDGDEHEFTVFIIHGRSEDWRKVERFIKDDLDYDAIVIKEVYTGDVLNKKVRRAIEASDCAVAIMSPDDRLANGKARTRQNVILEIGECRPVFRKLHKGTGVHGVVLLKEQSVDINEVSDLSGIEYLGYTEGFIETTFHKLRSALEDVYAAVDYSEEFK
ncbi:MAG: nucleotide-binding protein [Flavobacteriales bacterium]|nr:MAG: nucleotide-binding protein [Flavobacteriales bacterium]